MFVDEANVSVHAGRGGDGMVTFRREKYVARGGPAGGDGGRGGDVVLEASDRCNTLADFRHTPALRAQNGRPGGPNRRTGRGGEDKVAVVPVGTIVTDTQTGEIVADLTKPGERVVVARGGDGGFGNARFKTSTNRAPRKATEGWPGEERELHLELKLIADVALVGYPSVGKSTLIAALSNAKPRIADYPFTTLTPNLGVVKFGDFGEFVIADVPGLIEGAHEGHGLGIEFLKHIERTRLIAHIIEVRPETVQDRDPLTDFERITSELEAYDPEVASRPTLVVLNKLDLPDTQARLDELAAEFARRGLPFLAVSAATTENLDTLRNRLGEAVSRGAFGEL